MPGYSFNAASGNRSGGYTGLGNIQQFGYANPYGPYSFLPRSSSNPSTQTIKSSTTPGGGSNGGEAFFNSVLSGERMPFSPATRSALSSKASDMTAAAEAANNATLNANAAAGGASANDPSLQAARLGNQAARQTQNVTNEREIDTQANQANFGAQFNAAEALNRNAINREGFANGMTMQAMNFLPWNQSSTRSANANSGGFWGFYPKDDYNY